MSRTVKILIGLAAIVAGAWALLMGRGRPVYVSRKKLQEIQRDDENADELLPAQGTRTPERRDIDTVSRYDREVDRKGGR